MAELRASVALISPIQEGTILDMTSLAREKYVELRARANVRVVNTNALERVQTQRSQLTASLRSGKEVTTTTHETIHDTSDGEPGDVLRRRLKSGAEKVDAQA